MRRLFLTIISSLSIFIVIAQSHPHEAYKGALKTGLSYVYDFPGVKGAAAYVEYVAPFNNRLQGAVGIKRIQTSGTPRSADIKEYTRATTIDFTFFIIPLRNATNSFKVGLGYSSSLFNIRRALLIYNKDITAESNSNKSWLQEDVKGRSNGMNITTELEHFFSNNISVGAKLQYTKAYQYVLCGGPFISCWF
jgi:hypothetical protein